MTEMFIDSKTASTSNRQRLLIRLLILFLTVAVPVLLTLLSVRMVMTPVFLQIEYNRPGFPPDFYGFSTEDRLQYAPYALDYLLNAEGIDYLGDLIFPDGSPLYNERELAHMEDVKVVTRAAFWLLFFGLIATTATTIYLWLTRQRNILWRGLFNGAVLTLAIIVMIVLVAVVAWDYFFTLFHQTFFASGTWIFNYSDTLIRLFPEQFWFDAALTIGAVTLGGALLILFLSWRGLRHSN